MWYLQVSAHTVQCFYAVFLQVSAHTAVFINEPRLLEFKLLLLKEGIQAEFSAGVLICNNCVAIKRVSDAAILSVVSLCILPFAIENTLHLKIQVECG